MNKRTSDSQFRVDRGVMCTDVSAPTFDRLAVLLLGVPTPALVRLLHQLDLAHEGRAELADPEMDTDGRPVAKRQRFIQRL